MRVPADVKVAVNAKANTWAFDEMRGDGKAMNDATALSDLIGKAPPAFELDLLDDEKAFALEEHLGKKVIVLDFWATWCGPCIKAMPEVMAAAESFGDEVQLIAVNQEESPARVKKFLGAQGWDGLKVAMDNEATVRSLYKVSGIPTTVIIGKNGKIIMVHKGYQPGLEESLKEDIQRGLGE